MKRFLWLVLALLLVGCGFPAHQLDELAYGKLVSWRYRGTPHNAIKDVAYVPGGGDQQMLDIYPIKGATKAPVFVFFHGGSWSSRSRHEYAALALTLAPDGVMVVSADYRLYPGVRYPTFVDDAVDAVNWVHAHIAEYGGDPDRIFVGGHSAGGHITAIMLMNDRFRQRLDFDWRKIAGAVLLAGAYDLKHGLSVDPELIDGAMGGNTSLEDGEPERYIRADVPPMLLVQGDQDTVVFTKPVDRFVEKMKAAGAPVTYARIAGGDHLSVLIDMMPDSRGETYQRVREFLRVSNGE